LIIGGKAMKKARLTVFSVSMVLLISGCSSSTSSQVEEAEQEVFLPKTSLVEGLGIQPEPFTDNEKTLRKSFEMFKVYEYASGSDVDYTLGWKDESIKRLGILSDEAKASNRERDQVNLVFNALDIKVYMDGGVELGSFMTLNSKGSEVIAFCNGLLVEVSNEAFKLPKMYDDCSNNLTDEYDFDSHYELFGDKTYDQEYDDSKIYRMYQLMAQNSFKIRLVDTTGKEHVFSFDIERDYPSPQDLFRIAFEAEKAVKLGLGY